MKMKARTAILIALLVCALLVSGIALAQGGGGGQPNGVMLSGGRYRLASLNAQGNVIASGGRYRLMEPASPKLTGNGCCCIFLPCVMRNH